MLGLLALAAVGLVIVDVVSYTQLRSYLLDRAEGQAQAALGVVGRTLVPLPPKRGHGHAGRRVPVPFPFPPPAETGAQPAIPPGVFGEVRGRGGKVIRQTPRLLLGGATRPRLPSSIPVSPPPAAPRTFKAPAPGSGSGYVAAATQLADDRTVIAAVSLQDVEQTLAHLRLIGAIVTGAVLAALAALAWWVIRVGLRPLERMEQTAGAIAAGDLSARVESTDDRTEVGRLGIALNAMLGQIERAFAARAASEDRMRRFLADASHELRTPLTSIRGYAEAFRLGPARDPDKLETAMSRIEDEAGRMGVLVDDLLTLARLDEVREPVRRPVDLAAVAAQAAEDAMAAVPERRIDLRAAGPAPVLGDADQLRRAVLNLLRNAVQHTPRGTPIEVTVTSAADEVTLMVRDHGPGLPEGAAEHVFERERVARVLERGAGGERGRGAAGLEAEIFAAQ